MKIVVLTGSFNPITKAHYHIMEEAINLVNADMGLFVATNQSYLRHKCIVKQKNKFILSDEIRKNMIESLNLENEKMFFGGYELGGASPSTEKTLRKIIKKYPSCELYYLCGADKLKGIPKWGNIEELLKDVKLIVCCRTGSNIDNIIDGSAFLTEHKDRILKLENDVDMLDVSSTKLRSLYFNGENYKDLMNEGPYNILNKIDPTSFKELTDDDLLEGTLKYGGRFSGNAARLLLYKINTKMFNNWDSELLGNRNDLINNTVVYKDSFEVNCDNNYDTIFDCVNEDCADTANRLLKDGYNPAILNLASRVSPCGEYHHGCNAQEESLAQMSTLSQSLYQFGNSKYKHIRKANLPNIPDVYPLDINFGGIYSPNVTFFRNNMEKYYSLRKEPFKVSIITVASLANRISNFSTIDETIYFNTDGTLTEEGISIEKNKIRTIFRIGLANGHDSLVLGAFGCGVYNLLPSQVSSLFRDVLAEHEFKGKFRKIVFSILEGNSKKKIVGKEGKFKPFYDLFGAK